MSKPKQKKPRQYRYELIIRVAPGTALRHGYRSHMASLDEVANEVANAIEDSTTDVVKVFRITMAAEIDPENVVE